MAETGQHHALKRLGAQLLLSQGFVAVGLEVRCPIAQFRVDVAGYADGAQAERAGAGALLSNGRAPERDCFTVFLECKQARADFLRDRADLDRLLRLRDRLEEHCRVIEASRIRAREPHLRRTDGALFAELEAWDFHASRDMEYQACLRALARVEEKIHGQTKFGRIARYRLANLLYVVAPRGMIRPDEVPGGWGLLEIDQNGASGQGQGSSFSVARPAPWLESQRRFGVRVLRNIAAATTRDAFGARGWSSKAVSDRAPTLSDLRASARR